MADSENPQRPGLLDVAVRTLLIFQGFIAGLAFLLMGINLFWNMNDAYLIPKHPPEQPTYSPEAYPVVRQLLLLVFTAIVIYIIIIQWNPSDPHPETNAKLELAKGLLATATWLLLLLDIIFYTPPYPYDYFDPYWRYRRRRIIFTATSIIILCIFFYPVMFWRARLARQAKEQVRTSEDGATRSENTPLLRHQ